MQHFALRRSKMNIGVLGTYIQDKIVAEISEAGAFSLLADEASDSSNKEQLLLTRSKVCRKRKKCQRRIRWVLRVWRRRHWSSYSYSYNEGRSRTWLVYGLLQGTVLWRCRQPCNGAAAIVRWQYPKAIYTHFMAHRLNLSDVSACKMQNGWNMFDTVEV